MRRYLIRRILQAAAVLWAAYTVSFLVLDLLPGDPVSAMAGAAQDQASFDPAQFARLKHEYGFDKPIPVQYADYLGRAVRGDFGDSVATGRPVTTVLTEALPPTLQLTAAALLLAVLAGGGLAVLATWTSARWLRQALLSLPPLGVSVPTFWVGLMLVELLSFRVHLFPAFGDDGPRGLVLPALTMAVMPGALIAQVLAKSLLGTLEEPYVQTARAKGAGRTRVHLRHALRNAALPALTILGVLTGMVLANSVVIETVFSRNGLGRVTAGAVGVQDIPVVQGVVMFAAVAVVTVNLAVDLLYPLLDPRIVMAGRTA
ncbi:ABC transporter permease [Actinomadura parmotrematis]|uniref:ABC transporter permease n=1 Tax=Actinomadura parmotrematis TaxID=2864039 RepID=A0ABS7G2Q6_9ACTN|nr:ABC transporter permease [Actinomadura parmotrematis]MBW8486761.1 ABC transporter permease [Actinomadura parmotrematis]